MIDALWQRANLLIGQQRWDLAERELRHLLTEEPAFAPAHALLAIVLAQTGRLDEAQRCAEEAIALDPESDFALRALAGVHFERRDLDAAARAIASAIEIDPEAPEHRAMLAQVRYGQERWQDCVDAADRGLALDPQDTDCLNLRSLALTKLGRSAEADASVEASLAHDPDNPYTHQARGFALLHQGDGKGALHHFQEALRRDPTLDGARAGLVEAIKSRNPLYRLVLAPFVWMERFPPARRTQILIGAWLLAQVGRRALSGAGHETAARVVSFSWLGVVLVTACIVPIFNLLLLLHPIGRHALDAFSRRHALLLGAAALVCAGLFVASGVHQAVWLIGSRWFWLIYLLPVAGLGLFFGGWARRVQQVVVVGLLVAWGWWVWQAVTFEFGDTPPVTTTGGQWNSAVGVVTLDDGEALARQLGKLMLVAALSTWFTLLAPKGHRPRRRRA